MAPSPHRKYPDVYYDMLTQFANTGPFKLGPMSRNEAYAYRQSFYRLRSSVFNCSSDPHAMEFSDVLQQIQFGIEGSGDQSYFCFNRNRLIELFERGGKQ